MNRANKDVVTNHLSEYRQETSNELKNILSFWSDYSLDEENGGFVSHLSPEGIADHSVPKGAVLNARILWTFSAANRTTGNPAYKVTAERSYQYFKEHFIDQEKGGVFWSLHKNGKPENDRKQIYALAFAIYGLSEYYRISKDEEALEACKLLYHWIEKYSYDKEDGGYIEAVDRSGAPLDDMRLSPKDRNDPKTMNTHLHILEAYANLYLVWKEEALKESIEHLLHIFLNHIVDAETGHLRLFFNSQWKPTANIVSYGHDIEAAWLLLEAAEALGDSKLIEKIKSLAIKMADATASNLQQDGSLYHEKDLISGHVDTHREWWVTAEAMVGFLNAYEITEDKRFLEMSLKSWGYAQSNLIDHKGGEWFWSRNEDGTLNDNKVGFWKCPYHNARACMEVIRRCEYLEKKVQFERISGKGRL